MQADDPAAGMAARPAVYSPAARRFHWITVAAVFVMIPLGLGMTYRGNSLDLWDGLTNGLYSAHKLLGFLVLWLTAGRLAYRLLHGAPLDEPTLEWWQKAASHLVHWALYGLLLVVPLLGWIGVSLYPALTIFDLFNLPALAAPNEEAAKRVLALHGWLAILLALAVAGHIVAALSHHFIRKDGVLRRMLPGLR
jgi:cytochrome b561